MKDKRRGLSFHASLSLHASLSFHARRESRSTSAQTAYPLRTHRRQVAAYIEAISIRMHSVVHGRDATKAKSSALDHRVHHDQSQKRAHVVACRCVRNREVLVPHMLSRGKNRPTLFPTTIVPRRLGAVPGPIKLPLSPGFLPLISASKTNGVDLELRTVPPTPASNPRA